jgi:F1F0 ATPase subunit 2
VIGLSYLEYAFFAGIGAVTGALYFLILYRTVRLYSGGAAVARVLPLYLLRAAGAIAVFWMVAREGAIPLLLALAGFLVARYAAQQMVNRD